MKTVNQVDISFLSVSGNEAFARAAAVAFLLSADPTVNDISDVKTALSEAVTNSIIHAYKETTGKVYVSMKLTDERAVIIKVRDKGSGIADVEKAMEPLFSTGGEEQAGIGFSVMQSFSDSLKVKSAPGKGTTVTIVKKLSSKDDIKNITVKKHERE
ncbi:MAG: anti-sigma F factor [Ruminococcaceae bacterium]|nr:anti-sigma F factor [Oscillospiraceae bacterium]